MLRGVAELPTKPHLGVVVDEPFDSSRLRMARLPDPVREVVAAFEEDVDQVKPTVAAAGEFQDRGNIVEPFIDAGAEAFCFTFG